MDRSTISKRASKRVAVAVAAAVALGPALSVAVMTVAEAATPSAPIKVTQTHSDTVTNGSSVNCNTSGTSMPENHFYRRFDLSGGHAAAQGFTVSEVVFGTEARTSSDGIIPGHVVVSAIDKTDALILANLELIATVPVNLASAAPLTLTTTPIAASVPAGKDMVLEVEVDATTNEIWFPGSNGQAETAEAYFRADGCAIPQPVTFASVGFPNANLVLFARGKAVDCVTGEAAVTSAETAAAMAVATAAKADKKLGKAKTRLKKAKISGNPFAISRAKKKAKKAKKAAKAAQAALATANAALAKATQTAAVECAQPALPRPARSAAGSSSVAQSSGSASITRARR